MKNIISLLAVSCALTACASTRSTENSWSCRAVGNTTCASISQIDNDEVPNKGAKSKVDRSTVIFGAEPAAWWDRSLPTSRTREEDPRRESDQTMRIVMAPFIDAQGDYHDRMSVFAVMRKANWWVVPPEPVQAQPKDGTRLDAGDQQSKQVPPTAQATPTAAPEPTHAMTPPTLYAVPATAQSAPAQAQVSSPAPQAAVPVGAGAPVTMQPIPDPAPKARVRPHRYRSHH